MDDAKQSIARSFDAALRTLDLNDRVSVEIMRQLLFAKLDVAIAQRNRKRNLAFSVLARLPNELWSAIWQDSAMRMDDYIHFSQVCHAWRSFALLSPRLWRSVSFKIIWPLCERVSPTNRLLEAACEHVACATVSARHLDLRFARLEALLPRSSPLTFDLTIWTERGHVWFTRFVQTVSPHSHHIGKIHTFVPSATTLPAFLGLVQTLPALRELVAITTGSESPSKASLSLTPDLMPHVQKLNLYSHDLLLPETARMRSVRELSFSFSSAENFLRALRSFPNLDKISLCLRYKVMDMATFQPYRQEIKRLAAPMASVRLVHVYPGREDPFLDVLYRPARQDMTVEFWEVPNARSLAMILGGLGDSETGVKLVISNHGGSQLVIKARTEKRRRRVVVYRLDYDEIKVALSRLWDFLPLSAVGVLDVDADTWTLAPVYNGTARSTVTHLRIVIRGTGWFTEKDRDAFPWTGPHPARFPLLRQLSILGPEGTEVDATLLLEFIEAFGLGLDEQCLEVNLQSSIILVGDSTDLRRRCNVTADSNADNPARYSSLRAVSNRADPEFPFHGHPFLEWDWGAMG